MTATPDQILRMFREGLDTHEIGKRVKMPEATVSRHLWTARCQEKGLPAVYVRRGVVKQIGTQAAA